MTCLIEFEAPEEMDCVKGKDIPAMLYSGFASIGAEWRNVDYVPLSGEMIFSDVTGDENFEGSDQFYMHVPEFIKAAGENNVKAYYIGADGMPFIGFEMINPNYGYKTYSFFNEVKGYFKPNDDEVEYMLNATPVTSNEYYKAMLAKMS